MAQYFTNIYEAIKSSMVGMSVTFGHLFKKSITLQYPKEKMEMPNLARLKLDFDWEDCTGCNICVRACPVDCIILETVKATKDEDLGLTKKGTQKRLWVTKYVIDYSECMYCALCVYPCPEDCLYMTTEYEDSLYDRNDLIVNFTELTESEISEKNKMAEREKAKKEALRTTKALEKTQTESKLEKKDEGTSELASAQDELGIITDYVNKVLSGDEDIVKNIEDRVLRSKVKKALFKARRTGGGSVTESSRISKDKTEIDKKVEDDDELIISELVDKGLAGDMEAIVSIENRMLRIKVKKALIQAKRERGLE